ncbi:MAG TPA: hypothetical protein PLQ97_12415 [Myxococcota bacterium]|nr:hypothetical protein [Myxococcota bacterium]HQK51993.1 hypothetical protein [Myxococcota bacterium]
MRRSRNVAPGAWMIVMLLAGGCGTALPSADPGEPPGDATGEASGDPGGDLPEARDVFEDIATTEVPPDARQDASPDAETPEVPGDFLGDMPEVPDPPRPEAIHEVRTRSRTLPDGPWSRDEASFLAPATGLPPGPVRGLAFSAGTAWVATDSALWRGPPPAGPFVPVEDPEGLLVGVRDLGPRPEGGVLAATPDQVQEMDGSGNLLRTLYRPRGLGDLTRAVSCGDGIRALADGRLLEERDGALVLAAIPQEVRDIACQEGALLVLVDEGLFRFPGLDAEGTLVWRPDAQDKVTRVQAAGPVILVGGPDLAVVLSPPEAPVVLRPGPGAIPTRGLTALALSPAGRSLALGHPVGASWIDPGTGRVDHYASPRWLPSDQVTALAFESEETLWVATTAGVARITWAEIDLEAKARRMFGMLNRWFVRLDGFVSPSARFPSPEVDDPATLYDNDNDGQWTEEAVGAFCLAFAVTGDEAWRTAARKAIRDMALLIDVPARDFEAAGLGRGFVARSVVRDDEGDLFTSKATQSNWHRTTFEDGHDYYWKDDTSSDEVTGHLFGWSLFHDLCAETAEERAFAARHLGDLAGYLLRHDYRLLDLDGLPTTHGDYSPGRIPIAVDGLEACAEAGHPLDLCLDSWGGGAFLDSVEILALMLAAWHVTGEARFLEAYEELHTTHRYREAATFHPNVVTWTVHGMANYCDHELADLAFYTLLRYEPYPDRRAYWIAQMMAAWEYEVGERNPLKAMAMASAQAEVPGLPEAIRTLVLYPEDLREWPVDNAHRVDYLPGGTDRHGDAQFLAVPPHDEIAILRWDHNPYRVSGHGDGASRMAPTFWLLPYWGLRYHGVLEPDPGPVPPR